MPQMPLDNDKERFDVVHGLTGQEAIFVNNRLSWLLVTQAMVLAGISVFPSFVGQIDAIPQHVFVGKLPC
jgi:hypothetical protein